MMVRSAPQVHMHSRHSAAWGGVLFLSLFCWNDAPAQSGFLMPVQIAAGEPILNEFGQVIVGDGKTPVELRPLVHILEYGTGILSPDSDGYPQNTPLAGCATSIGTLIAPVLDNPGLYGATVASPRPGEGLKLFARVYNKPTIDESLFYSDSTNIMTVTGNNALFSYSGGMTNLLHPYRDTDADGLPDWWEHLKFGGNPVGADATVDYDGDGMTALEEYVAGTDPFDDSSAFAIASITPLYSDTYSEHVWTNTIPDSDYYGAVYTQRIYEVAGEILSWPSVYGRVYRIEYTTNIMTGAYVALPGAAELIFTYPANSFTNTYLPGNTPVYYRTRVKIAP